MPVRLAIEAIGPHRPSWSHRARPTRRISMASSAGSAEPRKLCKRCKQRYRESENTDYSCRYHPANWCVSHRVRAPPRRSPSHLVVLVSQVWGREGQGPRLLAGERRPKGLPRRGPWHGHTLLLGLLWRRFLRRTGLRLGSSRRIRRRGRRRPPRGTMREKYQSHIKHISRA